ncbi:MAG: hypothetical protein NVS2B9_01520 [Myxococcales bacterium]
MAARKRRRDQLAEAGISVDEENRCHDRVGCMETPAAPMDLEGLTGVTRKHLGRSAVRLRESKQTLSAWRLETSSAQGDGAIVLIDLLPPSQVSYRGEGVYLGWPQEKLATIWRALSSPPDEGAPFELPQLG